MGYWKVYKNITKFKLHSGIKLIDNEKNVAESDKKVAQQFNKDFLEFVAAWETGVVVCQIRIVFVLAQDHH